MIRILQIGLGPNPGGVENCIMNYYGAIDHSRFQFDFIDMYGKGLAYEEEIRSLGGKIYSLPSYKKAPFKMAQQLKKVLTDNQYEMIHINMLSAANMIPVFVSCKYGKGKVIVHSHNSNLPTGGLRRFFNTINISFLRSLPVEKWACGYKAGQWMWGEQFSLENVIPNAIDEEKFIRKNDIRLQIRKHCGFEEGNKVIGFVGRLFEQKNVLFLADIFAELCEKSKQYRLLIVGEGPLKLDLEKKLRTLNINKYVYFAGIQSHVYQWYYAMDAFVLPSLFEGLPVVGIEAQASGIPCFLSNTITDEVNISGNVKYLPIDQSAKIWADAINETMKSDELNYNFLDLYRIKNAVKLLEQKYVNLLER